MKEAGRRGWVNQARVVCFQGWASWADCRERVLRLLPNALQLVPRPPAWQPRPLACLQITVAAFLLNPLAQAGAQAPRSFSSSRPDQVLPILVASAKRAVTAKGERKLERQSGRAVQKPRVQSRSYTAVQWLALQART